MICDKCDMTHRRLYGAGSCYVRRDTWHVCSETALEETLHSKLIRRRQACHFRGCATSVPAEEPLHKLDTGRCKFPFRTLQAQSWHIYRSSTIGGF